LKKLARFRFDGIERIAAASKRNQVERIKGLPLILVLSRRRRCRGCLLGWLHQPTGLAHQANRQTLPLGNTCLQRDDTAHVQERTSVEQAMTPSTVYCSANTLQSPAIMAAATMRRTQDSHPQALTLPVDKDGLATLSHELKTPLVALLGFVQLMEADVRQPLSSTQRRRAVEIERAGKQMLDLVTSLLSQARRGEWSMSVQQQ
jgi:signal transduction histidine kinase